MLLGLRNLKSSFAIHVALAFSGNVGAGSQQLTYALRVIIRGGIYEPRPAIPVGLVGINASCNQRTYALSMPLV